MPCSLSWNDLKKYKVSPAVSATLRHADVQEILADLVEKCPNALTLSELGRSTEGRSITQATLGNGPIKIMLWSQMHGNEPTHTAVLLDLLSFLQTDPTDETASILLQNTTLQMILMLNPDGVERGQRKTALEIDINRDAAALATPEARLLQSAISEFAPDFGFNLHNQHRLSAVAGTLQQAAISLLVPSPDESNQLNANAERARLVASSFLSAVADICPGAISKYRAEYMPRAFGESIQRQGVSTLLIEAGQWTGHDDIEFVGLHTLGLIAALHAIATGEYEQADPQAYESLPLSAEHRLFDVLVRGATICNGIHSEPFQADLGINFAEAGVTDDRPKNPRATVTEIADLSVTRGVDTVAGDYWCMPGQIAFDAEVTPSKLPSDKSTRTLVARGVTTLLGILDLEDQADFDLFLDNEFREQRVPINIGFVGLVSAEANLTDPALAVRINQGVLAGLVAIVCDELPVDVGRGIELAGIPILAIDQFAGFDSTTPGNSATCTDLASRLQTTYQLASLLAMKKKGQIALGVDADLCFFEKNQKTELATLPTDEKPIQMLIDGRVACREGCSVEQPCGKIILRTDVV